MAGDDRRINQLPEPAASMKLSGASRVIIDTPKANDAGDFSDDANWWELDDVLNYVAERGGVGTHTATVTGDGTQLEWEIVHNTGTINNKVRVWDNGVELIRGQHFWAVPKVGSETTVVVVRFDRTDGTTTDTPLASGVVYAGFVERAGLNAGSATTLLFGITGYIAAVPDGATVQSPTYADYAAFVAAVPPDDEFLATRLIGYPTPDSLVGLESRWDGTAYGWSPIT